MGVALAHPHIWIDVRTVIVFDDDGALSAIRHQWTFDQAFSAWSIQGLDTDGDGQISGAEFQSLADENMVGLVEYAFYTFAGTSRAEDVTFSAGLNPRMDYDGSRTTLSFTLVPDAPVLIGERFEIEIADPEYYAALIFLPDSGVLLENAPEACSAEVNAPKVIDPALEQQLFDLGPDVTVLPAELKGAAADLANVVILSCGSGAASRVLAAMGQDRSKRTPPFAAPPAEIGLPVVRTGFLGWVNRQQQSFYGALTNALGKLKQDNNAFWALGGLSFLYGLFHAAGPGHGKIVISSYVLATEAQARRGILLSFASAMLQSLTAVVFVLIAALALNMTSIGLSQASNLLAVGSYILVILLGAWLTAAKILGFDHNHNHAHHVVTPGQAARSSNWREALGVVMAVGLRPCSGALVVLVFALSQGVLLAGIAAVFLMGIGTALMVAMLATLAIGAKGVTRMFAGGRYGAIAADVMWWFELFGALLVFGFGVTLLMASI